MRTYSLFRYVKRTGLFEDSTVEQAFPEYLEKSTKFSDSLIYFYHPQKPIVICGVHQNVFSEVDMAYLNEHNIDLVRRGSGGGAVYVDPGNLTYVFIDTERSVQHPDFKKYAQPILQTMQVLGVHAKANGRNDLTVDNKKFSGMSASKIGNRVSYGGTLMIDVDLQSASRVLKPTKAKLKAKGVQSVHSRVTNIRQFFSPEYSSISIEQVQRLILEHVFHTGNIGQIPTYQLTEADWQQVVELAHSKYGTKQWVFAGNDRHDYYRDAYFQGFGTVGIGFSVKDNRVTGAKIYGDFLQTSGDLETIESAINGTRLTFEDLTKAFGGANLSVNLGNIKPSALAKLMVDPARDESL